MGGCDCNGPKGKAKYVCKACGKEEIKEDQGECEVKSCCGQIMEKKED